MTCAARINLGTGPNPQHDAGHQDESGTQDKALHKSSSGNEAGQFDFLNSFNCRMTNISIYYQRRQMQARTTQKTTDALACVHKVTATTDPPQNPSSGYTRGKLESMGRRPNESNPNAG